jgi:hypothetical protein
LERSLVSCIAARAYIKETHNVALPDGRPVSTANEVLKLMKDGYRKDLGWFLGRHLCNYVA